MAQIETMVWLAEMPLLVVWSDVVVGSCLKFRMMLLLLEDKWHKSKQWCRWRRCRCWKTRQEEQNKTKQNKVDVGISAQLSDRQNWKVGSNPRVGDGKFETPSGRSDGIAAN